VKILVIDNYDSFVYNLVHYLQELDCEVTIKRNDQFKLEEVAAYDRILLSPGPGIPDEIAAHLFEPFHTTKPKGHGLGLFAVKHIVEMYHGSVGVETAKGVGTSFIISLPAAVSGNGSRALDDEG